MWLPMDATPGEFVTDISFSFTISLLGIPRVRPAFAHSFFCLHLLHCRQFTALAPVGMHLMPVP
jgi:hypothetical protein